MNSLEGKKILLTGATGFVGKSLLELMLRDHGTTTVYCLVRRQGGKRGSDRILEILDNKLFDVLRDQIGWEEFQTRVKHQLIAIEGDMSMPGLGISQEDRSVLEEDLELVIHGAATVDFSLPLKESLKINTLGTMELIKICDGCRKFIGFVHISTAYVNANLKQETIQEKLYPIPFGEASVLIEEILSMTINQVEEFTRKVLKEYPNTYTFTKSLTEHKLFKSRHRVAIARPSVVTCTASDPIPGWADGVTAANAIAVYVGMGVLDSLCGNQKNILDAIPVDYVANSTMQICADLVINKTQQRIYHLASSSLNPLKWKDFGAHVAKGWRKLPPLQSQMFPPDCQLISNPVEHQERLSTIQKFKFERYAQLIARADPALGSKLSRMSGKLGKVYKSFNHFTMNSWIFDATNMIAIERISNNFSSKQLRCLDWEKYLLRFVYGLHYFVLMDSISLRYPHQIKGYHKATTDVQGFKNTYRNSVQTEATAIYILPNPTDLSIVQSAIAANSMPVPKLTFHKMDPQHLLDRMLESNQPFLVLESALGKFLDHYKQATNHVLVPIAISRESINEGRTHISFGAPLPLDTQISTIKHQQAKIHVTSPVHIVAAILAGTKRISTKTLRKNFRSIMHDLASLGINIDVAPNEDISAIINYAIDTLNHSSNITRDHCTITHHSDPKSLHFLTNQILPHLFNLALSQLAHSTSSHWTLPSLANLIEEVPAQPTPHPSPSFNYIQLLTSLDNRLIYLHLALNSIVSHPTSSSPHHHFHQSLTKFSTSQQKFPKNLNQKDATYILNSILSLPSTEPVQLGLRKLYHVLNLELGLKPHLGDTLGVGALSPSL